MFSKKSGHKNGHFQKKQFLLKNSGLRPIKALFASRNAFFVFHYFATSKPCFFGSLRKRHPSKKTIFIVFLETHVLHFSQNELLKEGLGEVREKEDNEEKGD